MTPPERRSARALQIGIGVLVSAALVWWAFRKTDFSSVWEQIKTVRVLTMLAAIALATLPFALRVPRWKLLLRREDDTALPDAPLWHAIAIGFAANNVLPLRAGEVLRVAAISRIARVPFAAALSSVAVERVLDGLTAVGLLGIGLMTAHLPEGVTIGKGPPIAKLAVYTGSICVAALVMAIIAAWQRETALRIVRWILPKGAIGQKLVHFADNVLRGLGALRDPRRAIPVILWSLLIWLINGSAFYVAFLAFGFDVPFSGALILQGALMFGIALPSSPGFVGVFETIIPAALSLYAVNPAAALACAVTYHVTTFIPITFLGALSAARTGVHLKVPPATP